MSEIGLDADAAPATISTTQSKTTSCGQWLCGDFCPEQWHSVALTVRGEPSSSGSSDDDSLCSPSVSVAASANQLDSNAERQPSSRNGSDQSRGHSGVVSAELTLDGQSRLRVTPGTIRRASTPTATSYEVAQQQILDAAELTQSVITEWMRNYPQVVEEPFIAQERQQQEEQTTSSNNSNISKPARKVSSTTLPQPEIVLSPPSFKNRLDVTLGSSDFSGHVKGVALSTRQLITSVCFHVI
jgi:hypothetical protein